jgi:hypothetical protein
MKIELFGRTLYESRPAVPDINVENVSELAELLLSTVPELSESFSRADIELALDDKGWLNTSKLSGLATEDEDQVRIMNVAKSRLYWRKDPLSKQSVRIWTDYSLGTGITFQSEDAGIQDKINAFVKDRRNRAVMSSRGQRKSSKKVLIDGEVYFVIFTGDDGSKVIRWVDPMQITDIITDPQDSEHILGYRRKIPARMIGGQSFPEKVIYYADWTSDETDRSLAEQQTFYGSEKVVFQDDAVVYHAPFDDIGKRGNGLLFPVIDWTREHRRFMEARVAITQALSKYAFKLTAKGGEKSLNAIKAKLQSTYASTAASVTEKNPQQAPGGTWAQNQALDLAAAPRATGGSDAKNDGDQLKLMVCAGTGVFLHYYGDPSTGNLATATAMELPMQKMFESYQEFWKDVYKDIFTIVCDENSRDGIDEQVDDLDITITLPPIVHDDLTALGQGLNSIAALWPEIAESDEIFSEVLASMEVPNINEVLPALRKVRKTNQDKQNKKDDLEMKMMQQGTAPGANLSAKEAQELTTALTRLSESLSG